MDSEFFLTALRGIIYGGFMSVSTNIIHPKTSGVGFYATETNAIICGANGEKKSMLFARQKESIYAFEVFSGDIIITKEQGFYVVSLVVIFSGKVLTTELLVTKEKSLIPQCFQEAVKALDKKLSGKQSCQYCNSQSRTTANIINNMINCLKEYKATGNEALLQQLTADFSALVGA